ncbi:MAG TPA: acetyl-CoA carboxylase biotin carboxyl carrier protein subunit [Candidatus Sulfotelmatobacter sp.]|nr:acetyl-CoA carboxylase biotin carboxyl carrier protein subunit [Candidatus Sulfotelmatobacter sp.]
MKLRVTIDQRTYDVDVEAAEPEAPVQPQRPLAVESAPLRAPTAPPRPSDAAGTADEKKICRSPVTGVVVRVAAQVGQMIQTGDVLLVLEAMKMETTITAPTPGKVADLKVSPGDSVQAGQVVVQFE